LLDELHRSGRGQRLGHRRDPAHSVDSHLGRFSCGTPAMRAFVDHALAIGRGRNDAGHIARCHAVAKYVVGKSGPASGSNHVASSVVWVSR
jgi:hypothetical protein